MAKIYVSTTGNDSTGDGSSGNPYASIGKAGDEFTTGDAIMVEGPGTYVIDNDTPNTSGGPLLITSQTDNVFSWIVGWDGSDDDIQNMMPLADRPVILVDTGVTDITVIDFDTGGGVVNVGARNIVVDGAGESNVTGFKLNGDRTITDRCRATGCTIGFTPRASGAECLNCYADDNGKGYDTNLTRGKFTSCVASNNSGDGFYGYVMHDNIYIDCLSVDNGGWGFSGVIAASGQFSNCTASGNGSGGFNASGSTRGALFINCISTFNTGKGWDGDGTILLYNCAGYSNSDVDYDGVAFNAGFITLTADPFEDKASGDYTLNDTSGGGAELRGAGYQIGE